MNGYTEPPALVQLRSRWGHLMLVHGADNANLARVARRLRLDFALFLVNDAKRAQQNLLVSVVSILERACGDFSGISA